jgi:hypothetical protein
MNLDATTISVIIAAVTVTLDRAVVLVKAAREHGTGRSCSTDHELMCKTLDQLAKLQEKEVEILHGLSTSAEITKLMLQDRPGGRDRSYSPMTVELIHELDRRRMNLAEANRKMSDPPPSREREKRYGEKK